jgi:hypothetical protein
MTMNDPLENYDSMNEFEQAEAEQKLLDKAFRNSFLIVTERKTFENVVKETGALLVAHDPFKRLKIYELDNMMAHFSDAEEYEKCAEIRDIITKLTLDDRKQEEESTKGNNKIFHNFIKGTKRSKNRDS